MTHDTSRPPPNEPRDGPPNTVRSSNLFQDAKRHDIAQSARQVSENPSSSILVSRNGQRDAPSAAPAMSANPSHLDILGQKMPSDVFELVVRCNRAGKVTLTLGHQADFPNFVAYVTQLAEWLGQRLGLDRFAAMECTYASGSCFIVCEASGEVLALKPKTSALVHVLRELLDL